MNRTLVALLLAYAGASFIHFAHNAHFVADYPNLPASWSSRDIYAAWLALSSIGVLGWLLLSRRRPIAGLIVLMVYASLGMDSLGHYVLAPMSQHTVAMNFTILLEVATAACVFVEAARQVVRLALPRIR